MTKKEKRKGKGGEGVSFEQAHLHFTSALNIESLVGAESVQLLVGHSPWLGKEVGWEEMVQLYEAVYIESGLSLLKKSGYFVLIQTDTYEDGRVLPKNALMTVRLLAKGYELLDMKVWKRQSSNFFQLPYTLVSVFRPRGGEGSRAKLPSKPPYIAGVWDYPIKQGGIPAFPFTLCKLLVESFTEEGDLVVDPFAGRARLLGSANKLGRAGIGTEIDESLREDIEKNLRYPISA